MLAVGAVYLMGEPEDQPQVLCYEPMIVETPPVVWKISLEPASAKKGETVRLRATAYDYIGNPPAIFAVEAFLDRLGDPGKGIPLLPADSAFDEGCEEAYLDLETGELSAGTHRVYVRARDYEGTWGEPDSAMLEIK